MAIAVTSLGTNNNKSTGVTFFYVDGLVASAGDWIIVVYAGDNNPTTYRFTDDSESTDYNFTKDVVVDNSGNACCIIGSLKLLVDTAASDGIVFHHSSNGACAITVYKVTGISDTPLDKTSSGTGSGTDANTGASGVLSQADEIVFAASAVEDEVDDPHGTWSGVTGNEQFDATNGGGDASNQQAHSVAQIVSATTSLTGIDAGHHSINWAAAIATYKMATAGWPHKFLGVANASIGKINGVAIADILKVNGVA